MVGSLIWSGDGLRSVEEVQVGDLLIGFDPAAFVRTTVTVERVHVQKVAPCVEVLVGGRLLLVHERGSSGICFQSGTFASKSILICDSKRNEESLAYKQKIPRFSRNDTIVQRSRK